MFILIFAFVFIEDPYIVIGLENEPIDIGLVALFVPIKIGPDLTLPPMYRVSVGRGVSSDKDCK